MKYKFDFETGAIISKDGDVLTYVEGDPVHVDFPEQFIWDVHQKLPGYIDKLAHVHPPGMVELSNRDKQTMKTWAFAVFPFTIKMSTITLIGEDLFTETTYLALLEPRETWEKRGKSVRKFEIRVEHIYEFYLPRSGWLGQITKKSYSEIK